MTDEQIQVEADRLLKLEDELSYDWERQARPEQLPPDTDWLIWLLMTGRGWGKTRTGAETMRKRAEERKRHIAVIANSHREARNVCFEAPQAGLLAVIHPDLVAKYNRAPGNTELILKNGSTFRAFSADSPDALRGYAFDDAWCDEYAAWPMATAQAVWDNLWFTLRESLDPHVVVSTTPRPVPHVKTLYERALNDPRIVLTRGHMRENRANLGEQALAELEHSYGGTRIGQQELAGELMEDIFGALWTLGMYEVQGFRLNPEDVPALQRIVVAVDPAMTSGEGSDFSGITVAGVDSGHLTMWNDDPRKHGYVLHSEGVRMLPEATMKRVSHLYHRYKADAVVVEANNGGDYLPAVLRQVDPTVNVRTIYASRGKRTRAEPVSSLYEQMRIHHVGDPASFVALEEQQTTWVDAPGQPSPDVLDSAVWALTELLVGGPPPLGVSRVRDKRLAGRR